MDKKISRSSIKEVKEKHEKNLLLLNGVEGVGISEQRGRECIVVYISDRSTTLKKQIPSKIEGYPVSIQFIGEMKAF